MVCSVFNFNSVALKLNSKCMENRLERKWRAFMKDQELLQNCDSSQN